MELTEPEYTDLLNASVPEKKRKLCPENTGGSNVRVKKETGNLLLRNYITTVLGFLTLNLNNNV